MVYHCDVISCSPDAAVGKWTWADGAGFQTPPYQDFDNLAGQSLVDHPGLDCFSIDTCTLRGQSHRHVLDV